MPENTILLLPLACLAATWFMVRRAMRPKAAPRAEAIEIELRADTGPLVADLRKLNPELERTAILLERIESGAGAISRAARATRSINEAAAQPARSGQRKRK